MSFEKGGRADKQAQRGHRLTIGRAVRIPAAALLNSHIITDQWQ